LQTWVHGLQEADTVGETTLDKASPGRGETLDELDEQLAAQLVEHARARGTGLVGPDGLLGKLTKLVFETGLEAEMDEHLGYEPHEAAGRNSGNSRNGVRSKTVTTEIGPIEIEFLARWPTNKAMQHARDRIRELTARHRLLLSVKWIVEDLNRFLRGWAAYFRYGNSAQHFDKIMGYARMRLAIVISRRHRRSRAFGWSVIAFQSPDYLGLINLDGTVAAPRPFRAWRVVPNAGGERRR
jgi:hypothetical protein